MPATPPPSDLVVSELIKFSGNYQSVGVSQIDQKSEFGAGWNFSVVTWVGKIDLPIRGTPYSPNKLPSDRLEGQNRPKMAFLTILRKFLFFFGRSSKKVFFY